MDRKNQQIEAPLAHYRQKLKVLDPVHRAGELGLVYEDGVFILELLNKTYRVSWPEGQVQTADPGASVGKRGYTEIVLLHYLTDGLALCGTGRFLPFGELPWGQTYLAPFTGRCLKRLAYKFGTDLGRFCRAAETLGGTPVQEGDAGFEFVYLDGYRLRLVLWEGDEEFPPNAQILFSDNFAAGFSAEDCVVAAELIINALQGVS